MTKVECRLIARSVSLHLQQIYTGYFMLHKSGRIDLSQSILKQDLMDETKEPHLRDARYAHLDVIVNGRVRLHYDMHDSWEIDEEYLGETDYYFKRSFSRSHLEYLGERRKKIHALGLNYAVYPSTFDKFGLKRNLSLATGRRRLYEIVRSLDLHHSVRFAPRVNVMESAPVYDAKPKILFSVRAFDPADAPRMSGEKILERIQINEVRAKCIEALKREFGDSFYGGFVHTDFAVKNYREFLMPNNKLSRKGKYIELLRSHPIGVATTGIHGSIGWKFGEYVAFSKAILSEKLNYEVPGDLEKDRNYLEFASPSECVEKANRLYTDRGLRSQMMANNAKYYQSYLRPDVLVLNTIVKALSDQ